jgi:hypothetical protein
MNETIYLNATGAQKLFGHTNVIGLPCRVTNPGDGNVYHEVVEASTGAKIGGFISADDFSKQDPGEGVRNYAVSEYHAHTKWLNEKYGRTTY